MKPTKHSKHIPISSLAFTGNEEQYVLDAVRSTWVSSLGKYIDQFELQFAEFLGAKHAVSVNNGTCALILALKALDIGPGDEVIVPSFTFAASVNAIIHAGATPVLVDSYDDHWNVDPAQIQLAITPATKAIMPVHLYGHPCDMQSILELSRKNDLITIEDAAEAHNAECVGKKVGTIGHVGCFSFYGNKVMTSGEGGMCLTNDSQLADKMKKLRDHGMNKEKRYWHDEIGFNFRLTNLNAAVGLAQLEQLEQFLDRRAYLAGIYDSRFENLTGVKPPMQSPFGKKINWMYCLFLDEFPAISRDELLAGLKEYNIDARPTFYPLHLMPPYVKLKRASSLKNAELFGMSGINLPLFPSLTEKDINYIADGVRELLE